MKHEMSSYEFHEKGIFVVTDMKSIFIPYDRITYVDAYKGCTHPSIRIHHGQSKYTDAIDIPYKTEEEMNIAMRGFVRNYQQSVGASRAVPVELSYAKRHVIDISE